MFRRSWCGWAAWKLKCPPAGRCLRLPRHKSSRIWTETRQLLRFPGFFKPKLNLKSQRYNAPKGQDTRDMLCWKVPCRKMRHVVIPRVSRVHIAIHSSAEFLFTWASWCVAGHGGEVNVASCWCFCIGYHRKHFAWLESVCTSPTSPTSFNGIYASIDALAKGWHEHFMNTILAMSPESSILTEDTENCARKAACWFPVSTCWKSISREWNQIKERMLPLAKPTQSKAVQPLRHALLAHRIIASYCFQSVNVNLLIFVEWQGMFGHPAFPCRSSGDARRFLAALEHQLVKMSKDVVANVAQMKHLKTRLGGCEQMSKEVPTLRYSMEEAVRSAEIREAALFERLESVQKLATSLSGKVCMNEEHAKAKFQKHSNMEEDLRTVSAQQTAQVEVLRKELVLQGTHCSEHFADLQHRVSECNNHVGNLQQLLGSSDALKRSVSAISRRMAGIDLQISENKEQLLKSETEFRREQHTFQCTLRKHSDRVDGLEDRLVRCERLLRGPT